jgi:hypothetical protein
MKKLTLALSLLAVLGAASCKKDDDKKSSGDSWTVGGKTYSASGAAVSGNSYSFSADGGKSTLVFSFKAAPASGTLKVENNDVTIMTGTTDPVTIGTVAAGDVNVTVNGEEVNIKCSGLTVAQTDMTGTKLDNTTLTADVTY